MIVACTIHLRTFLPMPRCKIDLASNDGMNALCLCFLIKSDSAVHHTVISNGNRIHPEFFRTSDELLDSAGSVEQTVLGMHMQMGKGHSFPPFS